jgi:hypothetical protein
MPRLQHSILGRVFALLHSHIIRRLASAFEQHSLHILAEGDVPLDRTL